MNNNSLNRNKLLLITAKVSATSAQGVRYLNLFEHFKTDYDLSHLTYGKSIFQANDVKIYEYINPLEKIFGVTISKVFRKIGKLILFPDQYVSLIRFYKEQLCILSNEKFDIIIIGVTPFSLIRLNPYIKKFFPKAKLINDFSDPFSANAEYYYRLDLIKKAIRFESKYLPFVDLLVVLNDKIKEYYSKQNIYTETIEQGLSDFFSHELTGIEIKDYFNLAYAGNFYKNFRDPENLFEAINISKYPIKFTIYGGKPKAGKGLGSYKSIINIPYLNQKDLAKEYSKAHLLIVIDNFYGMQVPGKTLECFTFNRPVLLIYNNDESPTLDYVKNTKGIFIVENDKNLIKETIEFIFDNYKSVEKQFDSQQFLWEELAKKYNMYLTKSND